MPNWRDSEPRFYYGGPGTLYVYATAEVITPESAEHGDAARRGWVSDVGSTELRDYRNDAGAAFTGPLDNAGILTDDYADDLRDLIERLGAWESDDGRTLYASDSVTHDYTTDEEWMYAIHGTIKHYVNGVVVEDDIRIII